MPLAAAGGPLLKGEDELAVINVPGGSVADLAFSSKPAGIDVRFDSLLLACAVIPSLA